MINIKISYLVSTRNRLSFLRILNKHVFHQISANEELIVVDGNSTDGSKEFLQDLHHKKIIHQFISEPDLNQAHGWNKALLLARGRVIKKIIDDDIFDLPSIRKCADLMLQTDDVEFCISNHLQVNLNSPAEISLASRYEQYEQWRSRKINCFTYSDITLLIRRTALSKFGLFDTQFRMLDWEYALRCTYMGANIAYYQGCMAFAVSTPGNVTSTTTTAVLKKEEQIGKIKYGYGGDHNDISLWSKAKISVGKLVLSSKTNPQSASALNSLNLDEIYEMYYKKLTKYNLEQFQFIY